jgi:hypothetical protein
MTPHRVERSPPPQPHHAEHSPPPPPRRERHRSPVSRLTEPRPAHNGPSRDDLEAARQARLAQMSADADSLNASRATRLAQIQALEKAEFEREEAARKKAGPDGKAAFMRQQEKIVFGGGMNLEERLKRGRVGLVRESD